VLWKNNLKSKFGAADSQHKLFEVVRHKPRRWSHEISDTDFHNFEHYAAVVFTENYGWCRRWLRSL